MYEKSSPEKIIKQVETYLEDINVPNYTAIQALKKGIKSYPGNTELKEKLKKIEKNNLTSSTPKTMYGALVIIIGVMGLGLIYSWATNLTNNFGVILGVVFVAGAIIIFKQYLREK